MGVGASAALSGRVLDAQQRIQAAGDNDAASVQERLAILAQLQTFSLGRALLSKGGLDALSAAAITAWPLQHACTASPPRLQALEAFLLLRSPTMLALQQQHAAASSALQGFLGRVEAIGCAPGRLAGAAAAAEWDAEPLAASASRVYAMESDPIAQRDEARGIALRPAAASRVMVLLQTGLTPPEPLDALVAVGLLDDAASDDEALRRLSAARRGLAPGGTFVGGFWACGPGEAVSAAAEDTALDAVLLRDVVGLAWPGARPAEALLELMTAAGFKDATVLPDSPTAAPLVSARA